MSMNTTFADPPLAIVSGFHALSEPIRLKILDLLREQEVCVCDLSHSLGIAQSKLSFHLKALKDAQLVQTHQEGRWIYYRLNLTQFLMLEEYLSAYRRLSVIRPTRICGQES
ncbi:MAG: ArsR family transcriptional regulator [Cyanobacteria bacterium WB6_1B_304]|nr:ArsR family transcriptional regulator [Cyanobacteria bacterium WB6_1B_304]